jgi:hypothetical protein
MDVLKTDFCEHDETMFQCVERTNELILRVLSIEKTDLDEVA